MRAPQIYYCRLGSSLGGPGGSGKWISNNEICLGLGMANGIDDSSCQKVKGGAGKHSYTSFQMLRIGRKLSRFVFNINGKSTIEMESGRSCL